MSRRNLLLIAAALSLAACRKEASLEELLAQPASATPSPKASADALMDALAQQPIRSDPLDLPHPPATDEPQAAANLVTGTVLETMDASNYTYLKLRLQDGTEDWAAVPKAPVKTGLEVQIAQSMVMTDFHSASLKRTFPRIIFGNLVGTREASAPPPPPSHAAAPPKGENAEGSLLTGTVEETMDASSYTYVRVKEASGEETWAAITKAPVQKGARIQLRTSVVMHDFHSAALNRTFPRIVFASLAP